MRFPRLPTWIIFRPNGQAAGDVGVAPIADIQAGLAALTRRAAEIDARNQRAFGKVNMVFDHAEHLSTHIEDKADALSRFLGPPPNSINMPKQIEGSAVVEDK